MSSAPPVEFNPFLPEVRADPYPFYRELREREPVFFTPLGFWLLTRYSDVTAVLKDDGRMSHDPRNADFVTDIRSMMPPDYPDPFEQGAPSMLFVDPPDHTRLRSLVSKAFTARTVENLRGRAQQIVDEILDRILPEGEVDLVAELAYPLPITIITELLGVELEDRSLFMQWSRALVKLLDPLVETDSLTQAMQGRNELREYLFRLIADRRREPRDDLLTALIHAEDEGHRLSEEELISMCALLLVAGHETTVNLISNGTRSLLRHPDQLRLLRDDPSLIRSAVEEFLRYDSPVQLTSRVAMQPIEIDGRRIEAKQETILLLGAANRDPAQFADPDRLDITRTDNRHLAFGGGIHFCLGASLARMEAQTAIGTLVRRAPRLEPAGTPELRDTITLRGLKSLPVRL